MVSYGFLWGTTLQGPYDLNLPMGRGPGSVQVSLQTWSTPQEASTVPLASRAQHDQHGTGDCFRFVDVWPAGHMEKNLGKIRENGDLVGLQWSNHFKHDDACFFLFVFNEDLWLYWFNCHIWLPEGTYKKGWSQGKWSFEWEQHLGFKVWFSTIAQLTMFFPILNQWHWNLLGFKEYVWYTVAMSINNNEWVRSCNLFLFARVCFPFWRGLT